MLFSNSGSDGNRGAALLIALVADRRNIKRLAVVAVVVVASGSAAVDTYALLGRTQLACQDRNANGIDGLAPHRSQGIGATPAAPRGVITVVFAAARDADTGLMDGLCHGLGRFLVADHLAMQLDQLRAERILWLPLSLVRKITDRRLINADALSDICLSQLLA